MEPQKVTPDYLHEAMAHLAARSVDLGLARQRAYDDRAPEPREIDEAARRGEIKVCAYADERPDRLVEFAAWVNRQIIAIPEEYRSIATLEVRGYTDDGDDCTQWAITYVRPETDEEWAARRADVERRLAIQERLERATFEAMKAKFGEG